MKTGKRAPVTAVMEQARVNAALGRTHEAALGAFGWPAPQTDHLLERVSVLDQLYSTRSSTFDASKDATQGEKQDLDRVRFYIDRIRTAVPLVLRRHPTPGVTEGAFKIGEALGRSVLRHIKYLMKIRPFVETLEEHLKPFFGNQSPLAELDEVKSALESSDTMQESLRGALPASTLKILEVTGEIFELIDDMNRIAKLAFKDNPEIAAQFNKNLIERACRTRKRSAEGEDTAAETDIEEAI